MKAIFPRARAFTLIEMISAVAIAGVIIAGSMAAVMSINRMIADTGRRTAIWDESKRVEEFLIARVQGAGGGALRPDASVLVEDAQAGTGLNACRTTIPGMPNCNGSDRLTIISQDPALPACTSSTPPGVNLFIDDALDPVSGTMKCCLDLLPGGPGQFANKQAILIDANGLAFSVSIHNPQNPPCKVNFPAGQGNQLLPPLSSLAIPVTLIAVKASTFFVDTNTHAMKQWEDTNGDGNVDANETTTIHDGVYDVQYALAYDSLPEDGTITDAASSTDEWLFNAFGDPGEVATSASGIFLNTTRSQLRMLQIGIVVGATSELKGGNDVRLLNRNTALTFTAPKTYLAGTTSKAYLRNLNLFTQ